MRIMIVALAASLTGCGLYVHHGGGEYTFMGFGSARVARRCSPLAQDTTWRWGYDYKKLEDSARAEGKKEGGK